MNRRIARPRTRTAPHGRLGAVALLAAVIWAPVAARPAVATAAGCPVPLFAYRTGTVVMGDAGHGASVRVEIADTPEKQEVGLMCRPRLDPDAGMLFVFSLPTDVAFWMKNTLIPLAIVFLDGDWRIVSIMEMPVASDPTSDDPTKFTLYNPHKTYRYALEVNAGFFKAHGISERAVIRFVPGAGGPVPSAERTAASVP